MVAGMWSYTMSNDYKIMCETKRNVLMPVDDGITWEIKDGLLLGTCSLGVFRIGKRNVSGNMGVQIPLVFLSFARRNSDCDCGFEEPFEIVAMQNGHGWGQNKAPSVALGWLINELKLKGVRVK